MATSYTKTTTFTKNTKIKSAEVQDNFKGTWSGQHMDDGVVLRLGDIMLTGRPTIQTNMLECNGAAISRSTYADLFAVISTTFGAGDGSTTFNLPTMARPFTNIKYVMRVLQS